MCCLLLDEGHYSGEGRLATLEEPGEAADGDSPIQQLANVSTQVLDVDDVVGEQYVVGQLVVFLREEFVQLLLAELAFALGSDPWRDPGQESPDG